jgi:23S rRNA (cytosine1962-C5)-methyltransferase
MSEEKINRNDIVLAHKPGGVTTHRSSPEHLGFVEWLGLQSGQTLYVCHRLDKETTGAILFAKSSQAAAQLSGLFAQRKIHKQYFLVSDHCSEQEEWEVHENEKKEGLPPLRKATDPLNQEGESWTRFKRLGGHEGLYLYSAQPITGKTHQIRKHAVKSKIPILGDDLYGGSPFPRLMLHCHKLTWQQNEEVMEWTSPPSDLFTELAICKNPQLCRWLVAVERRKYLYPELWQSESQSLRLAHQETGDLRVDKVGTQWVMGWWKDQKPREPDLKNIDRLVKHLGAPPWVFEWRPSKRESIEPKTLIQSPEFKPHWVFAEGEIQYNARFAEGHNFGLFLDQRERRQWVLAHSQDRRVLNLFSYTCGFSVCAARGGAAQVISVDTMSKYLEWGRENFRLNGMDEQNNAFKFIKMDCLEYLNYAKRKNIQFDIIICDPPSFSRSRNSKKVFKIEKDIVELLDLCGLCLASGGTLLFSTNYEKWDFKKWQAFLHEYAPQWGIAPSHSQWDFELSDHQANLKAFFLHKH